MKLKIILLLTCVSFLVYSCSSNDDDTTTPTTLPANDDDDQDDDTSGNADSDTTNVDTDTPDTDADSDSDDTDELAVYQKIYAATDIYKDGDFVVIEVNGLPDHNSPYYQDTEWSDRYENNTDPDFRLNPNRISSADRTIRIPLHPEEASSHESTALGVMGVAINGVAFFNQYAGPNDQPLTNEIFSFDQYNGHPQGQGVYHYHIEPTYLTAKEDVGNEGLLGFLLDGFPVYGPFENNVAVSNNDLDEYHGHNHATEDYPDGIYHYHITAEDPYINGNGYYGTPGTSTD
ncbi:YHYH protein [Flammeovirga kamogawensis]|uniref:YHYH protein n=1 Tax=Flammeovirga kamogawensis TaxID=373891 RepID=A0ABX8GYA0_9BACT|nr:YHYH protein [Flammeovirga kamogawensis]MBB6463925.1 hypothetical protein [Flammeovirga kamogawensis]QWG08312.1 YHYH protein [Flammeovirga kamogawensis]TRX66608.1 YHYH protein [Flammeovirga kamogawensis]